MTTSPSLRAAARAAASAGLAAAALTACSGDGGAQDSPAAAPRTNTRSPSAAAAGGLPGAAATTEATPDGIGPLDDAESVPAGRTGTPRGGVIDPATVNGRDNKTGPDAVADAVTATFYRHDTRLDLSPADAPRRAKAWLTATYATALAGPRPSGGGAAWLELIDHDGYTDAVVKPVIESGAPPDTRIEAYRQRQVTVTAHGTNGWTRPRESHVLFIRLIRADTGAPWRVEAVTVA